MERVGHATGPDAQPEPVAQQRRDLAMRGAEVFVEQHDQRDGVARDGCSPPQAHPTFATGGAPARADHSRHTAHVHIEATDQRPHDREILLNLSGDARLSQSAAAVRARLGEGDVDPFVDRRRRLAVRMSPMSAPGATSRPPRLRRRQAFRQRRRLTLAGAPRRRQRARQALDVPPQAIPIAFQSLSLLLQLITIALQLLALSLQPRVVLTESFRFAARLLDLTSQAFQFTLRVIARARGRALRHATVMADSRNKYKPNLWIGGVNPLTSYGKDCFNRLARWRLSVREAAAAAHTKAA
jgi:hypothetical protein